MELITPLTGSRRKIVNLGTKAKGTSNPLVWDLPKTGILAGLFLDIRGAVAGTLSAPNAFGFSSIVSRVRLMTNAAIDLINVSGPGYHYLLRDNFEDFKDISAAGAPGAGGRTAVTATTFDISMFFPIALNTRDVLGMVMLQNEDTQLQLQVEFLADASVATGATVTANVTPRLELFTVPLDPKAWPPFNYLHTLREETLTVSGAGDVTYTWPRGNAYAALYHGLGFGASGADGWSVARVRVNQSDYLLDADPTYLSQEFARSHGRARPAGVIPVDFLGSSGLGTFGSARDFFDSARVTDVATVITATGAGTLYTLKRELVPLGE